MSEVELKDDHLCFACGERNPDGLRLRIEYPSPGRCRIEFVPPKKFQGWQGILHGGIIATILDEAFAHALGGAARGVLESAAEQQGLMQIVRDFCDHSNAVCDRCRFPGLVGGLDEE